MKLTIDNLKGVGAFAGGAVLKTVQWSQNGEDFEAEVYVRPMSYQSVSEAKEGENTVAHRIATHILNEDGTPVFTVDDVTGAADPERGPLGLALTNALMAMIAEVTFSGKKKTS